MHRNLDEELESEQIKRYQESINNVILTNYRRFILMRNREKIFDCNLFNLSDLKDSKYSIPEKNVEEFQKLIDTFFDYKTPTITSAKELAVELSKKAKLLRELAREQLEEDLSTSNTQSSVYDFYEALRELIKDVNVDKCVDAYAQTITYGLFLAKMRHPNTIDRETASSHIPPSIGVIRRIFSNISGDALPSSLSWIIDETVDILNASDMKNIVKEIDERGKKDKDPFTHFYEDFLALYDPEQRKHLGNYYTPRPVINFICNSVNTILRDDFDKAKGFAEDDVTVLDPAVGTGTFLWLVYTLTLLELLAHRLGGLKKEKIENHILKDFYGFEIQITPYIIAHLKLAMILQRWQYDLKETERIQVYLTNTLEPQVSYGLIPFMRELSHESRVANEVKSKKPILVILGNPPYYGMSANTGQWITDLVKKGYTRADGGQDEGYYVVDGKPLKERNPKWLLDDYVKFIRFAQWKIDTVSGKGIVGFITNHSYLDNLTFKGMRQSLFESFDRIYILDLHGNYRNKRSPDDENVFDILQGVAIALFIKNEKFKDKKVKYAELFGEKDYKYKQLDKSSLSTIEWKEIKPKSPNYYFVPMDTSLEKEYEKYWKITDIFPLHSVGVVTARDKLTIKWTPEDVWNTVSDFASMNPEQAREKYNLGKDVRDWKVERAQQDLKDSGLDKKKIVPILYRPFDIRYTYYTGKSRGFHCMPRQEVMKHMLKENLGLITRRQMLSNRPTYFFVTNLIISDGVIRSDNKGSESLFPLYLYSDSDKKPNINPEFLKFVSEKYGKAPKPEEIFYYIYAVLHSTKYRKRYSEFLERDFPRIPFTKDYRIFTQLSKIGKELVELHLMKVKLDSEVNFDIEGSNIVESIKYKEGRVYINKTQYFGGVPEDVWNFHIGGYQVLDKWLKSRKNKKLSGKEIEDFIQLVEILKRTIDYMGKINQFRIF